MRQNSNVHIFRFIFNFLLQYTLDRTKVFSEIPPKGLIENILR